MIFQVGNIHAETVSKGHNQGMRLPQPSSPRMAKSSSLGVMLDHDLGDLHIVDQDDIIGLTQDVKNFSDGLANLKAVFNDQAGKIFNLFMGSKLFVKNKIRLLCIP